MTFTELGLNKALVRKCESLKFLEPTPIQSKSIPVVLSGADLIGCAETGTGKTAAFLLPALQRLSASAKPGVRLLILAPTRELALQIEETYRQFVVAKEQKCVTLIGGASFSAQNAGLKKRPQVVIATPGRLLDHIERGTITLKQIEILVLDEADRMLDMGFLPAIRKILEQVSDLKQTLLFSATISPAIEQLARSVMNEPEIVEVGARNKTAQTIEQKAYQVAVESKTALLLNLLENQNYERVLVFTRTRRGAERLSHILTSREMKADRIHADRTQPQRETALREFRQGKTTVLIATDIASRGIDVDSVSHVINYDVPGKPEDYVHRIGRTGRAGNSGRAITLLTPLDETAMRDIERLTGQKIERVVLPGFGTAAAQQPQPKSGTGFTPTQPKSVLKSSSVRSFRPRRASR